MALTWREVTAPKLDTRDLALAGQTVGASFDKLGGMFVQREESLRDEATDAAIARVLANQDRNAPLVDPATLGNRVRAKDVLETANRHQSDLIARGLQNEELLGSEANAKYGHLRDAIARAIFNGGDEASVINQEALADPLFNRARAGWLFNSDRDMVNDNREIAQHNRANESNAAAQVAVARGQLGLAQRRDAREQADWELSRQQREQARVNASRADGFIQRYTRTPGVNMLPPDEQLLRLKQTPTWERLPPQQRALIETGLKARAEERQAVPEYLASGGANTQLSRVLGGLSRADIQAGDLNQRIERDAYRTNPAAQFIGLSRDEKYANATPATVAAAYDKLGYNSFNLGPANGRDKLNKVFLERLMNGPDGLPASVVQAVLENSMHTPWGGSSDKIVELLKSMVPAYFDQGETRKTEQSIAANKAPVATVIADKARVEQQARAFYAQYPGQPLPKELAEAEKRINARMEAITRKYTEAQESRRTK